MAPVFADFARIGEGRRPHFLQVPNPSSHR